MQVSFKDPLIKRYLVKPFVVFAVILSVLALLDGGIRFERGVLEEEERLKEADLRQLASKIRFLQYSERLFAEFGDEYFKLSSHGFVNTQDRVKWTDRLMALRHGLLLTPFYVQFEAEQEIKQEDVITLKVNQPIFFSTRVNLEFGLFNDMDLIRFLFEIERQISPLFLVERCNISSDLEKLRTLSVIVDQPIITARCSINFFESKPRAFKG